MSKAQNIYLLFCQSITQISGSFGILFIQKTGSQDRLKGSFRKSSGLY
ncbi:MAG: hypothetical protein SOY01_03515 [Campylobacter sp.]|nr:hypothetical protein [Campylobacter sp.]